MSEIKFGTDGWRGIIAEDYTFKNVAVVSQAIADYLGPEKKVAVGYDTRFMSWRFAEAAAKVFCANKIKVVLSDRPIPTPALSFAVRSRKLDLGIMITASHNPPEYNGYKIKVASGGAAGLEVTAKVEELLGKSEVSELENYHDALKSEDLTRDYVRFIRSYIDKEKLKRKKFKVLVDVMYGSGNGFISEVLKGTSIKLDFIRNGLNPSFGGSRPEPVEENLEELKRMVKKGKYDLGIALDGDADRLAAVGEGGVFIHPQKIVGLLGLHLNQDRHMSGGIVKTIAGSTMVDHIADFLKVKLFEVPVGFKYISDLMEKEDVVAGGEEAGGMGVKGYIPERDGTMAGLLLLEMMAFRDKPICAIVKDMEKLFGRYYYLRSDLRLKRRVEPKKESLPASLLGKRVVEIKDYDGLKLICEDESWLMFRASGTEPLMRLYSEAKVLSRSRELLKLGEEIIRKLQ